jgi:hypothetical protein
LFPSRIPTTLGETRGHFCEIHPWTTLLSPCYGVDSPWTFFFQKYRNSTRGNTLCCHFSVKKQICDPFTSYLLYWKITVLEKKLMARALCFSPTISSVQDSNKLTNWSTCEMLKCTSNAPTFSP